MDLLKPIEGGNVEGLYGIVLVYHPVCRIRIVFDGSFLGKPIIKNVVGFP
jgi:hypothetical protein